MPNQVRLPGQYSRAMLGTGIVNGPTYAALPPESSRKRPQSFVTTTGAGRPAGARGNAPPQRPAAVAVGLTAAARTTSAARIQAPLMLDLRVHSAERSG